MQFSIKDLRLLHYFDGLSYKGGTINWKRGNEVTASISIKVNTIDARPYIELDYKCKSALKILFVSMFCFLIRYMN